MKRPIRLFRFSAALIASSLAITAVEGGDPLNVLPTGKSTAEHRIAQLNAHQLGTIELSGDPQAVIFAFNLTPLAADERHEKPLPLLQVRSDGTFNCVNLAERTINVGSPEIVRTGKLTAAELKWLMHLAVNECAILERTTAEIDAKYDQLRIARRAERPSRRAATGMVTRANHDFEIATRAARNRLVIPGELLTVRSLRRACGLDAFASLQHYAMFIVNRQSLGDDLERNSLLAGLNKTLTANTPAASPFGWEHLVSAASIRGTTALRECDLSATFVQEVTGPNRLVHRIYGRIDRSEKGAAPTFTTWQN